MTGFAGWEEFNTEGTGEHKVPRLAQIRARSG